MSLNLVKILQKMFFWGLVIYLSVVAGLYLAQRDMIYFPQSTAPSIDPFRATGMEVVQTQTDDGLTLSAWHKAPEENKKIIVFFHGNASTHAMSAYQMSALLDIGYGFLSVGYRGYNGNDGKPSERGFYYDSRAWIEFLKNQNFDENDLILYSQSIGSGVAVQMATEFTGIAALVLESPYTSLPDVAAQRFFFVPVHWLMKDKFDSLSKIKDIKTPLLVIQGMKDKIIYPRLGQKLYAAANHPKKLIQIDDAGHNDLPIHQLTEEIINFIKN